MARKKENTRDFPAYLFHQGTNYKAQELLGAHRVDADTVEFTTSVRPGDQELICIVLLESRDTALPKALVIEAGHGVLVFPLAPVVEVPHDEDALGMGGPGGEATF